MFKKLLLLFTFITLWFSSLSFADITTSLELYNSFDWNLNDSSSWGRQYDIYWTTWNITFVTWHIGQAVNVWSSSALKIKSWYFLPIMTGEITISLRYKSWSVNNMIRYWRSSYFDNWPIHITRTWNSNQPLNVKVVWTNSQFTLTNLTQSNYQDVNNWWNHWAFTVSQLSWKLYRNWTIFQSWTLANYLNVIDSPFFVWWDCSNSTCSNVETSTTALVDELRVYSRALSASDISQLYNPTTQGECWTTLTNLCPHPSDRSRLYEYNEFDDTHYWACWPFNAWIESITQQCSLQVDVWASLCWTNNKQYYWSWSIPDFLTGNSDYCQPNNTFIDWTITYNSIEKNRVWFCSDPISTWESIRCDAKAQEYTNPKCWYRDWKTFSTWDWNRDASWITWSTDPWQFCEYWIQVLTWITYQNAIFNWTSTNLPTYFTRGCQVPSAENTITYCSTIIRDSPADKDRLNFDQAFLNEQKSASQQKFNYYVNLVLEKLWLKDRVDEFFFFLTPQVPSSIPLYFPEFTQNNWQHQIAFVKAEVTFNEFSDFVTTTCTSSWCTYTMVNWDFVVVWNDISWILRALPYWMAFLYLIIILWIVMIIVFFPISTVFEYLKEPMLFLSIRHIDDATNTFSSKIINVLTMVLWATFLLSLTTIVFTFFKWWFIVFIKTIYTLFYYICQAFTGTWEIFALTVSQIVAFVTFWFLVLVIRFVVKHLPI